MTVPVQRRNTVGTISPIPGANQRERKNSVDHGTRTPGQYGTKTPVAGSASGSMAGERSDSKPGMVPEPKSITRSKSGSATGSAKGKSLPINCFPNTVAEKIIERS